MKPKTLFDHLKSITKETYDKKYWNSLSESDKKSFSSYMIHRYLSMNYEWIEIVNLFQMSVGYDVPQEIIYKFYSNILPKSNVFLKYVGGSKSSKKTNYSDDLIDFMIEYYRISRREALEYVPIIFRNKEDLEQLKSDMKSFGFDDSQIKNKLKVNKKHRKILYEKYHIIRRN